ncbi:hypothetical protein TRIUR3_26889 [Triticum urartu]|uniref:Uncharacterized protein n=1 Tax=Triticum urartu TaxID=4572 RepID=M8AKQ7_TRIUA|nr:hypothetical protein TRIUR3_26889 [Triticum urartu]
MTPSPLLRARSESCVLIGQNPNPMDRTCAPLNAPKSNGNPEPFRLHMQYMGYRGQGVLLEHVSLVRLIDAAHIYGLPEQADGYRRRRGQPWPWLRGVCHEVARSGSSGDGGLQAAACVIGPHARRGVRSRRPQKVGGGGRLTVREVIGGRADDSDGEKSVGG